MKPETTSWFHPKRGDLVVDAGAVVGIFSLYAAKVGAFVIAVEPNPETFNILMWNVVINKMLDRIIIFNFGLGYRIDKKP
ncbi:MAG: FkbM family methyltransferase [Candidatus Parvarchaeum sp.]